VTILLSDPRVSAVPLQDNGDPLVALDALFGPGRALVRSELAIRLADAQDLLPRGIRLLVVEGHRPVHEQRAIIARYSAEVCAAHRGISAAELHHLVSRFVAPVEVAPNVRHPGYRWISPGGILAVALWIIASVAFAFYVSNFGSYNKTYGSLAAVIVFLVWLWVTNVAILLGAEMNAEIEREHEIARGHPAEQEPFLPQRDPA